MGKNLQGVLPLTEKLEPNSWSMFMVMQGAAVTKPDGRPDAEPLACWNAGYGS